jgi:monovalent cation/proton antiporter MnhG/PhaG subunit
MVLDLATAAAMIVGFFMLLTAIGLVRLPDAYTRMHAAGGAGTVGVALLILAPSIHFVASEPIVTLRGFLSIVFQSLSRRRGDLPARARGLRAELPAPRADGDRRAQGVDAGLSRRPVQGGVTVRGRGAARR